LSNISSKSIAVVGMHVAALKISNSLSDVCMHPCVYSIILCREKIKIPSTKPYITFYGPAGAAKTILVYGDTAAKAGSTSLSASTTVMSDGFIARGISFRVKNSSFLRKQLSSTISSSCARALIGLLDILENRDEEERMDPW
jgi:hypothetical protein